MRKFFPVTDDSGFLGLFDPDAYISYLEGDPYLEALADHLRAEMYRMTLLLWATGCEHIWSVMVTDRDTGLSGFREVAGPIVASQGRLCLTSYERLTMGAQFAHVRLPEPHDADLLLAPGEGAYSARIVQLADPEGLGVEAVRVDGREVDFVIELRRTAMPPLPWSHIPWTDPTMHGDLAE